MSLRERWAWVCLFVCVMVLGGLAGSRSAAPEPTLAETIQRLDDLEDRVAAIEERGAALGGDLTELELAVADRWAAEER